MLKNSIVALVMLVASVCPTFGQWTNGTDIQNTNTGKVVVGGFFSNLTNGKLTSNTSDSALEAAITAVQTNTNGGHGIVGRSYGKTSAGVLGESFSTSGSPFGVLGRAYTHSGVGVYGYGEAFTSGTDSARGVVGWSYSPQGVGLQGVSDYATGVNYGIQAQVRSPDGNALFAYAFASTGQPKAVRALVENQLAWAIFAEGGRNYLQGNTGIGTSVPTAKLHTSGSVRFQSLPDTGEFVTEKSLQVDANGNIYARPMPLSRGFLKSNPSSTATSWTVPPGVTRIKARMWGGGAATYLAGGSAGSGGHVEAYFNVTPGEVLTVTVGEGALPGPPGGPGNAGGTTSLVRGQTTLASAGGGCAGNACQGISGSSSAPGSVDQSGLAYFGFLQGTGSSPTPPQVAGPLTIRRSSGSPPTDGIYHSVGTGGYDDKGGYGGLMIIEY